MDRHRQLQGAWLDDLSQSNLHPSDPGFAGPGGQVCLVHFPELHPAALGRHGGPTHQFGTRVETARYRDPPPRRQCPPGSCLGRAVRKPQGKVSETWQLLSVKNPERPLLAGSLGFQGFDGLEDGLPAKFLLFFRREIGVAQNVDDAGSLNDAV